MDFKKLPTLRNIDKAYFEMAMKCIENNQQMIVIKRRGYDFDGYIMSVHNTAKELLNGKKILLLGDNCDKLVKDLKELCDIDVTITESFSQEPSSNRKPIFNNFGEVIGLELLPTRQVRNGYYITLKK